jgi:hypothetical protein
VLVRLTRWIPVQVIKRCLAHGKASTPPKRTHFSNYAAQGFFAGWAKMHVAYKRFVSFFKVVGHSFLINPANQYSPVLLNVRPGGYGPWSVPVELLKWLTHDGL